MEALRSWCYNRDLVLPEDELGLMMGMADYDKDGFITETEFFKLMTHTKTYKPPPSKKK